MKVREQSVARPRRDWNARRKGGSLLSLLFEVQSEKIKLREIDEITEGGALNLWVALLVIAY